MTNEKTIFITTTTKLFARVKQRYADFIVEEIYEENGEEHKCLVQRFNKPWEERESPPKITIPENVNNKDDLILELEKINTDTNKALALIARGVGVSKNRVSYAGLKDKRAITSQRISIYKANEEKLKNFGVKGLELRNATWGNRLELGDLKGNYFTLILRDMDQSEEEIKEIINDFSEQIKNGVPNFFGTQRFGGKRNVTHRVGKLLLQEDYRAAILLYLTETFEEEKIEIKNARINLAKTLDFARALKEFPQDCYSEIALLNKLVKEPNNFTAAFTALPKKTRYLFVHAYQSYIFNEIIKKRIELFDKNALKKIDGDKCTAEEIPLGLLPGFESTFAEGTAGEIEKEIMRKEGIDFSFFKVNAMPELSSKGMRKEISLFPKNFILEEITNDEFNEEKKACKITFFLSKGNYATTLMRELIKEEIF